jgi:hypothetical protein
MLSKVQNRLEPSFLLSQPCAARRPSISPSASVLASIVLRPPSTPTPLLPATQGLLQRTRARKKRPENQQRRYRVESTSSRNSLRMPEGLSSSWSIIIGNGLLVVYKCKHYKATLSAGTSGCGESTIITSSEGLDWKQSCIGCGGHCR